MQNSSFAVDFGTQGWLLELALPWPVSVNRVWRRSGRKIHKSDKAEAYAMEVACKFREKYRRHKTLAENLWVNLMLYPPDRRRRDIDNTPKVIFDALTFARVWRDDVQIKRLWMEMCEPAPPGHVVIQIRRLECASGARFR